MAKVVRNQKIVNSYLDQIDERNVVEKDRFSKVFKDYTRLLDEIKDLQDKLKIKDREAYLMNQFGDNRSMMSMGTLSSSM